ncbi:MAG TPA: tetratricopeptide repeat protein [Candidatus Limnocylindria bacterium]|nr:tetratricopeptide repeat protein [Candidatus Limnocylindria bacterium]
MRVRLLGPPVLEIDDLPLRLEGRKTWALLAYVLLQSRAPTRRELVDRLWSDADDPRGAARWALSQVRKALSGRADIVERDARLAFEPRTHVTVDALELLDGRWDTSDVEDLVRGPLLEGMEFDETPDFARWLDVQRARVAGAITEALRSTATLVARTDPDRALALAERGLLVEPYDEELHALIVGIHVARSDLGRARAYIEHVRGLFRADLDVDLPATISHPLTPIATRTAETVVGFDVRGRAKLELANTRGAGGDFAGASELAQRVAEEAASARDESLELDALVMLVHIRTASSFGDPRESLGFLQRAMVIANALGDRARLGDVECERGRLLWLEGQYGAADAALRRALSIASEVNDEQRAAWAKSALAVVLASRCEYDAAEDNVRDAIAHFGEIPYPLVVLARVLRLTGRIREARMTADSAVERATTRRVPGPLSFALVEAGEARVADGDLDGAGERFTHALAIARETGDPDWQALALRGLAAIEHRRGRPQHATELLTEALAVATARPGGMRQAQAEILTDLAELERGADQTHVERGLELALSAPMPDLAARLLRLRSSHTPLHTVVT